MTPDDVDARDELLIPVRCTTSLGREIVLAMAAH
jgi:hypothetical protein